mgnify:CR=1 FL=1
MRNIIMLFASTCMLYACSSNDDLSSSSEEGEGNVENSCVFKDKSYVDLNQKYGVDYIGSEKEHFDVCVMPEDNGCSFIFKITDMSFKEEYPYPKWDDYSHSGKDGDETGKGELDD